MIKTGKYKKSFLNRLGKGFPEINKEGKPFIWVHAVSFGETKAVTPLIKKLKENGANPKILLTTATETGFEEGKKIKEVDYCTYMPLDFSYIMKPLLKKVAPEAVVLVESDFWLNFLSAAKKHGAFISLVNGKISESSFNRLKKIPFFAKKLFSYIDLFCLQNELYKDRFEQLGVNKPKLVTGNIKLNAPSITSAFDRNNFHLQENDLVLTLGSTHAPEEALFLDHFEELQHKFPTLKIFVAPRHPERLSMVEGLLKKRNIAFDTLSSNKGFSEKNVLLIDKMGVLKSCYSVSDVAFVGGTFLKNVGGHNILEPSFYGVPVLYGPYLHSQPDFLALIKAYNGGIALKKETILSTLTDLLSDKDKRVKIGGNGKKLILEATSSLDSTYHELISCFKWK